VTRLSYDDYHKLWIYLYDVAVTVVYQKNLCPFAPYFTFILHDIP